MITKEEYINYAESGFNIIPLVKDLKINSGSPIDLYSKIKDKQNTFLLESIEGGEKWAQYSIIGLDCMDTIKITGNKIEIKANETITSFESKEPLDELNNILTKFKSPNLENMPRFYGGYVVFLHMRVLNMLKKKLDLFKIKIQNLNMK